LLYYIFLPKENLVSNFKEINMKKYYSVKAKFLTILINTYYTIENIYIKVSFK